MFSERLGVYCVLAATLAAYWKSRDCGFVFDDAPGVVSNGDVLGTSPIQALFFNDFWGTPLGENLSHKSYRPLTVLSFRLTHTLAGLSRSWFHLENVVYHLLASWLFHRLCKRIVSPFASFVAFSVFALHAVHVEAVTGVVGRAELLSAIGVLLALLLYEPATRKASQRLCLGRCIGTALLAALAMLCKEPGVLALPLCMCLEVLRGGFTQRRFVFWRLLLLGSGACALVGARFRWGEKPNFLYFENPAANSPTPTRQLTFLYLLVENARLIMAPFHLLPDYSMGTIPLVKSFSDARNSLSALLLLSTALLGWKAKWRALFAGALLTLTLVPATNLLIAVGFVLAERVLYMPTLGSSLLIGLGASRIRWRTICCGALVLYLLASAARIHLRAGEWQSETTLFRRALSVNRLNAKFYSALSFDLMATDAEEALRWAAYCCRAQPNYMPCWTAAAMASEQRGRNGDAERIYRRAIDLLAVKFSGDLDLGDLAEWRVLARDPRTLERRTREFISALDSQDVQRESSDSDRVTVHVKTGLAPYELGVYLKLGELLSKNSSRTRDAAEAYRHVLSMQPRFKPAYQQLAAVLAKESVDDARQVLDDGLALFPVDPDLLLSRASISLHGGNVDEAAAYLDRAVQATPQSPKLLSAAGITILRHLNSDTDNRHYKTAFARLERAHQLAPADATLAYNLAAAEDARQRPLQAEHYLAHYIELTNDASAMLTLARRLNERRQHAQALPILQRAVVRAPERVDARVLLATSLTMSGANHYTEARAHLFEALRIEPASFDARVTLCRLLIVERKLLDAKQCLSEFTSGVLDATKRRDAVEQLRKHVDVEISRGA